MSEVNEKPVMIALSRRAKEAIKVALAMVIVGLFPQERWLLMLGTSLFVGVTTYLLMGKSKSYF